MSVLVNFKSVIQGRNAESLARLMESVDNRLIAIVSPFDIHGVAQSAPLLNVWSQHVDTDAPYQPATGNLNISTAIERGATGAIINHAEHPIDIRAIKSIVRYAPNNFKICVCANDLEHAQMILRECKPDYIAVEPPEFIGKKTSMTDDTIKNIIENVGHKTKIICGAGIRSTMDVARATNAGAAGVLVSSYIVNSRNPEQSLRNLVVGLRLAPVVKNKSFCVEKECLK